MTYLLKIRILILTLLFLVPSFSLASTILSLGVKCGDGNNIFSTTDNSIFNNCTLGSATISGSVTANSTINAPGILAASSSLNLSGLNRHWITQEAVKASSSVQYNDLITFNIPGLNTGDHFMLHWTLSLHGKNYVVGTDSLITQAKGELTAFIGANIGNISISENSDGTVFDNTTDGISKTFVDEIYPYGTPMPLLADDRSIFVSRHPDYRQWYC